MSQECFINSIEVFLENSTNNKRFPANKTILKLWIKSGLLRLITCRDKLSKPVKKQTFNQKIKLCFKNYRNVSNSEIKNAKEKFYRNQIIKNNPRKMWKKYQVLQEWAKKDFLSNIF